MSRGQHKADKRLRTENPAAILGRKGGQTRAKKYGKAQLKEWGKLGGRPKKAKEPKPAPSCEDCDTEAKCHGLGSGCAPSESE